MSNVKLGANRCFDLSWLIISYDQQCSYLAWGENDSEFDNRNSNSRYSPFIILSLNCWDAFVPKSSLKLGAIFDLSLVDKFVFVW
jgi:hypothetical protein